MSVKNNENKYDKFFVNANLATMTDFNCGKLENVNFAIKNDKISYIGKELPENISNIEIIDLKNKWVTPGLIDCHTHIVYAGSRANEFAMRLHGASYENILQNGGGIHSTVSSTRGANKSELYNLSVKRVKTLLAEGVTCLEIKSGYGLDLDTEIKMLETAKQIEEDFNVTIKKTFLGAHALPSGYKTKDDYINYVTDIVLPELVSRNLVDAVDIFCEKIAFEPKHAEYLFKKAQEYNIPVKMHADQLSDCGGVAKAIEYNALSIDHLEYLSLDNIIKLKESKSNTVAVLLPGAFYFLKEKKLPPISAMREYNIPMAIATDSNPGSSPITSILLTMNMACVLFGLTIEESLLAVTKNASLALGINNEVGTLEVGKKANFVIWDVNKIEEIVYNIGLNPLSEVYYNGNKSNNW